MAEGLIAAAANDLLDSLVAAYPYVQLHTAAPGADGTTAVAIETDRVLAPWGAASGASVTTTTDMTWPGVAGTEDFTHFSAWSTATVGSCGFTGTITANPVTAGDDFRISAGGITASFPVAS